MRTSNLSLRRLRFAIIALVLLTVGCIGVERAPSREPVQTGATSRDSIAVAPAAPPAAARPESSPGVAAPSPAPTQAASLNTTRGAPSVGKPGAPSLANSETATIKPEAPSIAKSESPTAKFEAASTKSEKASARTSKGPPSPASAAPPAKKVAQAPVAKEPELRPLDLASLETRLRETNAIGFMTKLALKNQVDDLLGQFRAYYQGKLNTTLAELKKSFDLLFLKVLSLLQDGDPPLARAIVASRQEIWGILSDPVKFAKVAAI